MSERECFAPGCVCGSWILLCNSLSELMALVDCCATIYIKWNVFGGDFHEQLLMWFFFKIIFISLFLYL